MPRTSTPTSGPGSNRTQGSACTTRPRRARGSTRSSTGSATWSATPSAAACSPVSRASWTASTDTSTPTTAAPAPTHGPPAPRPSSPRSNTPRKHSTTQPFTRQTTRFTITHTHLCLDCIHLRIQSKHIIPIYSDGCRTNIQLFDFYLMQRENFDI